MLADGGGKGKADGQKLRTAYTDRYDFETGGMVLMIKKIAVFLLLLVATVGLRGKEYPVSGKVERVIVFPAAAQVVREAELVLPAGEQVVMFRQLPRRLRKATVRGVAAGTGGVTVLDTRVRRVYSVKKTSSQEAFLKKQLKALEMKVKEINRERSLVRMRLSFLKSLRIASVEQINKKIKVRNISTDDWERLYTFIFSKVARLMKADNALRVRFRRLDRKKKELEGKLSNLDSSSGHRSTTARVFIKTARRGRVRVSLEYEVHGVRWRPVYDLRLAKDGKEARVTYSAIISQRSGEDWHGARLRLSTAAASRWKRLPRIYPWYLSLRYYRKPGRGRKHSDGAMSRDKSDAAPTVKKYDGKQPLELSPEDFSSAGIKRGSVSVVFDVPGRTTIKSGKETVQRLLAVRKLPVTLSFRAYPAYYGKAFVEGKIKNTTGLYFLRGRARIFRDGVQIGKSYVSKVAAGETFKFFFGNDPRITTKKEQLVRKLETGSDNEVYYTYRLTVQNNRKKRSLVMLSDALPVSRDTKIEVDLEHMSMKPFKKTRQGIYSWKFDLAPGEKRTLLYKLKIEYPSKRIIHGLR